MGYLKVNDLPQTGICRLCRGHEINIVELSITVTSSLNEIYTDQQGKRVVFGGGWAGFTPPVSAAGLWADIYKDDVNGFLPTSDIFFTAGGKAAVSTCSIAQLFRYSQT